MFHREKALSARRAGHRCIIRTAEFRDPHSALCIRLAQRGGPGEDEPRFLCALGLLDGRHEAPHAAALALVGWLMMPLPLRAEAQSRGLQPESALAERFSPQGKLGK